MKRGPACCGRFEAAVASEQSNLANVARLAAKGNARARASIPGAKSQVAEARAARDEHLCNCTAADDQ